MAELQHLSQRHKMALRMLAVGALPAVVAEEMKMSLARIYGIMRSKLGQEYLATVEKEIDGEFKSLYADVVKVIRDGLRCADASVALASANLWMKAHGKFVHKVEHRDLTAEDIIAKIISGELRMPHQPGMKVIEEGQVFEETEFSVRPRLDS